MRSLKRAASTDVMTHFKSFQFREMWRDALAVGAQFISHMHACMHWAVHRGA